MSKRRTYNKMDVIKFAENHCYRETGRKFKIDESFVRQWVQKKEKLSETWKQSGAFKKFRLEGAGRKPCLSTIEDNLMEKIAKEREQQHHVSSKLITVWAKKMADENGLTELAASRGWHSNFLKRYNLTIRRRTTTEQSVPQDLKVKSITYVAFNKKQRDLHELPALNDCQHGWNADMGHTSQVPPPLIRGASTQSLAASQVTRKTVPQCVWLWKRMEQKWKFTLWSQLKKVRKSLCLSPGL